MKWIRGRARVKSKMAWGLLGLWFVWLGRQQRVRWEGRVQALMECCWVYTFKWSVDEGHWLESGSWGMYLDPKRNCGCGRLTQKKTRGQISVCPPVLTLLFHTFKSPGGRGNCFGVSSLGEGRNWHICSGMNEPFSDTKSPSHTSSHSRESLCFQNLLLHRILNNAHTHPAHRKHVCVQQMQMKVGKSVKWA